MTAKKKEQQKEKQKKNQKEIPEEAAAGVLHWADQAAERIIQEKGDKANYTVASGITPSGTVHIGNFREIITTDLIARALRSRGKKVRFIYSWDDYDVFRKVPVNMPEQKVLHEFLRKPIIDTPDTFNCKHESYARHHEVEVEDVIPQVGIHPEFLYQAKKYRSCEYAEEIRHVVSKRKEIKAVLDKYRQEPLSDDWLPLSLYCEKCNTDGVKITRYDEKYSVTYTCECGFKDTIDFRKKGIVKLPWRVDWPMRQHYEKVDFEPAGKEHYQQPGGSRITSNATYDVLYSDSTHPIDLKYDFIILKGLGGKMSSSAGNLLSPKEVLDIYEPAIVRWLFAGTRPNAEFAISFDADVIKIYEDFDRCERIYYEEKKDVSEKELANQKRIYELSCVEEGKIPKQMPFQPGFRHLTNILQQNEMDVEKTIGYFRAQLKSKDDRERLECRAVCAKNWLLNYAPEEFRFSISKTVPEAVKSLLSKNQRAALHELAKRLAEKEWEDKDLHEECYVILKNNSLEPKDFFSAAYKVLISKERGPKLAAFLIEIKEKAILLLKSV